MKSIDKLREWVPPTGSWTVKGEPQKRQIADEIEAEIAEHYQRLPVDADGVPIHVGDEVITHSGVKLKIHVIHLVDDVWWCGEVECIRYLANMCHHVKPRTLEDVLTEMLDRNTDGVGLREFNRDFGAFVAHYADEIRELLGGDAE